MKRSYLDGEQRHLSVAPQSPQSRTPIISKFRTTRDSAQMKCQVNPCDEKVTKEVGSWKKTSGSSRCTWPCSVQSPFTKVSRLAASALSRRFWGRFSTNPKRCRACPRVDGGNSGNCCGLGRPRNVPAQICAPPSSSNWPSRGQPLLETPAPLPSVRSAALRRSRGGTTRLLEGHRPRTALAEDGNPPANGMGIPSQRLGHRHRSPALDQKP